MKLLSTIKSEPDDKIIRKDLYPDATYEKSFEEHLEDFFSNPIVWIVIGCVFVAIIASLHIAGYLKRRKETKFTVALNNEGSIEYIIVKRNERVMLPLMKREGYKFGGWFVDTAMITPFMPTEKITYNRMLYAKWVKEAD